MAVYWLLFAMFALPAAFWRGAVVSDGRRSEIAIGFSAIVTALVIGLRYHVGADWIPYERMFTVAGRVSFEHVLKFGDPGYQYLSWAIAGADGAIWQVNLVCALLFCWGLLRLAQQQTEPWLAMLIAVPYLVVVVAMGYTRQAVAIGFVMAGLAALHRGASTIHFAVYVAGAALFHKTAVVMLPILMFAGKRGLLFNIVFGIILTVIYYNVFLSQSADDYIRNYLGSAYSSQGAAIRVALNVVPALLFLTRPRAFEFPDNVRKVYLYLSFVALLLPIALLLSPSSTVVDRLALYVIPLQIVVLGRAAHAFKLTQIGRILIIVYCALILFTWLVFANHAKYWVPYRFYPIAG